MKITLLTDGTSDRVLVPIIEMLFDSTFNQTIEIEHAINFPRKVSTLRDRVLSAIEFYPCDILIIHRDSEKQLELRLNELQEAIKDINHPAIFAVPVKMTESWLICSEYPIKRAVRNSNSSVSLALPKIKDIENSPDSKQILFDALSTATEYTGRRLQKFNPERYRARVSELMNPEDLQLLRQLQSFKRFEDQFKDIFSKFFSKLV